MASCDKRTVYPVYPRVTVHTLLHCTSLHFTSLHYTKSNTGSTADNTKTSNTQYFSQSIDKYAQSIASRHAGHHLNPRHFQIPTLPSFARIWTSDRLNQSSSGTGSRNESSFAPKPPMSSLERRAATAISWTNSIGYSAIFSSKNPADMWRTNFATYMFLSDEFGGVCAHIFSTVGKPGSPFSGQYSNPNRNATAAFRRRMSSSTSSKMYKSMVAYTTISRSSFEASSSFLEYSHAR